MTRKYQKKSIDNEKNTRAQFQSISPIARFSEMKCNK